MNRKKRIINILEKKLINFSISIDDNSNIHKGHGNFDGLGETHLKLTLTKLEECQINRLKVHRQINELLKEEFISGLHSLEINII
tara:strand:+ start:392 stop:646 length:255 start_codon:yes stop_codon:yes gene_type:complete